METTDLTIEVLKGIRADINGIRADITVLREDLGGRIDTTNERIDETNEQLHSMREELSRCIVESEIRTSTAIVDLAGTVRELTGVLRAQADLRPRVERCERDIEDIKRAGRG